MPNRSLQYATIFLTIFIDILGFGIVIPVLPLYAEHFGATAWQIGWLVGVFSMAQFFLAPVWGKISDRIGRKPVLLIGVVGTIVGYLTMGFATTLGVLFAARILNGISGANIGAAQAYLADISTPENRAKAMGLLGAAFGLGFIFGPALGGWASAKYNYATPMFIAAGLAVINFIFILCFLPESRQPGKDVAKREPIFPNLLKHVSVQTYLWSVVSYFLVIFGFSMMTTLFALMLFHRFDLDTLHSGYLFAGIGVIGVIIQGGLIGRLVKKFSEMHLAFVGCVLMALGLAGLASSPNVNWLLLACAAIGVGNSLIMPTLSAMASRSAEADWQGRALGVMQSGGSLARWLGPLVAGGLLSLQLATEKGAYAVLPLWIAAGVLVVAALAVSRLGRKLGG